MVVVQEASGVKEKQKERLGSVKRAWVGNCGYKVVSVLAGQSTFHRRGRRFWVDVSSRGSSRAL